MTYEKLDSIFPYVVFVYGIVCLLVLNSDLLLRLGKTHVPPLLWARFQSHRVFAWVSLFVGAFWILENLWL